MNLYAVRFILMSCSWDHCPERAGRDNGPSLLNQVKPERVEYKKITKEGMRSSLTAYAVSPAFVAVGMGPGLLALVAGADVFFLLSPRFSFDIAQT